jgi:hypothetical protein
MSSPSKPVSAVARGAGLSANKQSAKGATLAVMVFSASLSKWTRDSFQRLTDNLHCQVGFHLRQCRCIGVIVGSNLKSSKKTAFILIELLRPFLSSAVDEAFEEPYRRIRSSPISHRVLADEFRKQFDA